MIAMRADAGLDGHARLVAEPQILQQVGRVQKQHRGGEGVVDDEKRVHHM